MAKVEKDSSCAKCNYVTISNYRHLLTLSAFHSVHTPNCPVQPLGECISHNRRAFLNCSSAQVNSFAFHELPVKLALPRTGMSLTPVRHYATYHTDARWLNVCGTTPPTAPNFSFLPFIIKQRGAAARRTSAAVHLRCLTGLQASFSARGATRHQYCHVLLTGTTRHKLHYYLCTTT